MLSSENLVVFVYDGTISETATILDLDVEAKTVTVIVDHPATFSPHVLNVPTWGTPSKGEGTILVDNFEYWDSPYNHGWTQSETAIPNTCPAGYGIVFDSVLDLQESSRVLDVYSPFWIILYSN